MKVEAALTKTGRASTVRWRGSGKRDGKVFLVTAWRRVRGNKGARTAGVDGVAPRSIGSGTKALLVGLRETLKARRFVPQRVREKTIPKAGNSVRSLGIPTTADRIVQTSLKLALEPVFEADIKACFDEIDHTGLMERIDIVSQTRVS